MLLLRIIARNIAFVFDDSSHVPRPSSMALEISNLFAAHRGIGVAIHSIVVYTCRMIVVVVVPYASARR